MEQNSLPPTGPQEESYKHTADDNPADKGDRHPVEDNPSLDPNGVRKPKTATIVFIISDGSLGFLCGGLADFFGIHDAPILSGIFFCLFVAAMLAAIAIGVYEFSPHPKTIGSIFLLIFLALAVVVYKYSRPPTTDGWQPPELPEGCRDAWVTVGTFSAGWAISRLPDSPTNAPYAVDIDGTKIGRAFVKNNRLFVEVGIPISGALTTSIVRLSGIRTIEVPQGWEMNHNTNAMEIVNENYVPVYQLFYKSPNEVKVMGIFTGGLTKYAFGDKRMTSDPDKVTPEWLGLKPIFKYPSGLHPGELAQWFSHGGNIGAVLAV